MRVILDLLTVKFLTSYSTRPAHVFGPIGIVSGLVGFVLGLYLTVQKFVYDVDIGGRPLLLLAVLLIFIGFQFVTMGLLGEMLARTYHESQDRPVYVVGEVLAEEGTYERGRRGNRVCRIGCGHLFCRDRQRSDLRRYR